MLKARTWGHSAAKGVGRLALRSQLLSQAFQAWSSASCSKPTTSLQGAGTQRLRARLMTGPELAGAGSEEASGVDGDEDGDAAGGGSATRGRGGSAVKGGALPQAATIPKMATAQQHR